ncbi:hypothetical protein BKA70DRAFT_1419581 [Coprinopsis sp. MPI-PUGE-AT-0042]|nr:hypothetical protein BKA70DRAFT_1419581 [Coprinopsis sp. MPI-PUGE-AT-0042]
MPDYVYALHDFQPENEDEVDFRAGERIEVVEKDDLYGDGWWQGRNLAGKVGLFPQSYTTAASPETNGDGAETPPVAATTAPGTGTMLQPLAEESETDSPMTKPTEIVSPVPRQPAAAFLNGNEESDRDSLVGEPLSNSTDGEMMKATLTDVQKAIEQLGRNRADPDGGRSFSFASTRDGGDTDTDFDISDVEGGDNGEIEGEDWHKGARRKLAEKARQAVEDAQKLEAMMEQRSTAPPIDVELSDESEDEGDIDYNATTRSNFHRTHPHIPEEDEDEAPPAEAVGHKQEPSSATVSTLTPHVAAGSSPSSIPSQVETTPQPKVEEVPEVRTATQPTFSPPPLVVEPTLPVEKAFSGSAPAATVEDTSLLGDTSNRHSAPTPISQLSNLPSPTGSTHASGFHVSAPFQPTSASSTTSSTNPTSVSTTQLTSPQSNKEKQANEWSVEEVVDWLKSKGFDQDVCGKFIEQEITGDVLLELDANLLKTEIGIAAFGKRVRIANAIQELRRPPSIASFEPPPQMQTHASPSLAYLQTSSTGHSRTHSVGPSVHSYPGTPIYAQTTGQGSLPSPAGYTHPNGGPLSAPSERNHYAHLSIESAMAPSYSVSSTGENGYPIDGLPHDDSNARGAKGRPSHLTLSPSEGNLKSKVIIDTSAAPNEEEREDRAHMSDGEVVAASNSVRRRLFGRSHDSAASAGNASSRNSKDGASPGPSPQALGGDRDPPSTASSLGSRHKSKRSLDNKSGDRISIFGNPFGGALGGKGRKPPPTEDGLVESKSGSMFSRLHAGGARKSSSGRPTTPTTSPKASPIDMKDRMRNVSTATAMTTSTSASMVPDLRKKHSFDEKRQSGGGERATLRKRTVSSPTTAEHQHANGADATGEIKQGRSILDQVGEPDHVGWMRKKGVRYNSWKNRYCILKGEHMYILRSNSKSETKLKGYINIHGYKVTVDENLGPGRYGFRIDHDEDKTHYFSSDEKVVIREWMKAIMKATIGRDYTRPVVSSCNIPTIPLVVAQAMNPAPRPPSPTARDATQKALRRENPHQLSSRDARVLMGIPGPSGTEPERKSVNTFFAEDTPSNVATPTTASRPAPPRPSREMRRMDSVRSTSTAAEDSLIEWGNSYLPDHLQVYDTSGPLFSGLSLLRIAEAIKGRPANPPIPDSAFPSGPSDDKLDGLFKLFDFLLDNDVKMGSVSINDVRQGKRDKIVQLLKALKAWEDKRRAIAMSMASSGVSSGPFVAPVSMNYGVRSH